MLLPDGLTAAPLTRDDASAVVALFEAAERVDDTGEHHDAEHVDEYWLAPFVEPDRDTLVIRDGAEVVAAGATVAPPTFRDVFAVHLDGRVHPDRRGEGIGRALLDWQLERGTQVHAERHPEVPGRLTVLVQASITGQESLLRRAGLEPVRWFQQMGRALTDLPPLRTVDGVQLTAYDWARDEQVRQAHNTTFTEHYGSSERDRVSWQAMFTGREAFRPDLSALAIEDGEVLAYALAYLSDADAASPGTTDSYFGQIGVLPTARGRGLAKAVMVAALHAAADAGCDTASLEVDTDNVTSAVGLYESLGFTHRRSQVSWSRQLPAR